MDKKRTLYLTPKEVAEELNVHKNTVYRMIKTGELPIIKIYNRKYILIENVRKYISNQIKIGNTLNHNKNNKSKD